MLLTLSKRQCFSLLKQFLETEMNGSKPTIVRESIFKNQNVCFTSH